MGDHHKPISNVFPMFQGFFASLREELIMRKKGVSITICTIGLVLTENVLATLKKFKPETVSKFPQISLPPDAALAIIKGGAQRWNDVEYPRTLTFTFQNLYHIIPQMYCAIIRYVLA